MQSKLSRARYASAITLIVLSFYVLPAATAYAQLGSLGSLLPSGFGGSSGAKVSCNKNKLNKGLQNIFSGGDDQGGDFGNFGNFGNMLGGFGGQGGGGTNDGSLDTIISKLIQTGTQIIGQQGNGNTGSSGSNPFGNPFGALDPFAGTSGSGTGTNTDKQNTQKITQEVIKIFKSFMGSSPTAFPGFNLGSSANGNDFGADEENGGDDSGDFMGQDFQEEFGDEFSDQESVPIKSDKIEDNTKKTAGATDATNTKLNCTNVVEKAAAQKSLKELTTKTTNWVNKGFEGGGPLYMSDPNSFFKEMQDDIVKDFTEEIKDSENFPFGQTVAKDIIKGRNAEFKNIAGYSLDEVIMINGGSSKEEFYKDFSKGGWRAFEAQLATPNNPLGFKFLAETELVTRVRDTEYSKAQDVKDQLQRSGGYLDLKKCVSPMGAGGDQGTTDQETLGGESDEQNCSKWETQTPGSAIADSVENTIDTPFDQLEDGKDLNSELTSVFNSMLNQLITKGLASLQTNLFSGSDDDVQYENNQSYASNVSVDNQDDDSTNFLSAGNAFQVNFFDLDPTGIDQSDPEKKRLNLVGLINRERLLVPTDQADADKIAQKFGWTPAQKAVWIETVTSTDPNYRNLLGRQVNLTQRLVPAIVQLDFCVPGPHPGWQETAANNLQKGLSKWPTSIDESSAFSILKSLPLVGGLFGAIGQMSKTEKTQNAYAALLSSALTYGTVGTTPVKVAANEKTGSYSAARSALTELLDRYEPAVLRTYTVRNLSDVISPALVAKDAAEYEKIPSYIRGIDRNTALIASTQVTIDELLRLGEKVAALRANSPALGGYPTKPPKTFEEFRAELEKISDENSTASLTEYQRTLKRIADTFDLIAPDVVSQEDITAQQLTLDSIANKLDGIAGKGGDIEECIAEVSKQTTGPMGRVAFPDSFKQYLPGDFVAKFKVTSSFLPDFYYGQGQDAGQLAAFASKYGFTQDPKKTIQNDDLITIESQPIPNALAGLEAFAGIY